jgi:aminoglycoside phosphotransferase (APT) family kinase protein
VPRTFLISNSDLPEISAAIAEQFPDLPREYSVEGFGWDNLMVRVGTDHVARLPRRPEAISAIEFELAWLEQAAQSLTVPVPHIVGKGSPFSDYSVPWTINTWTAGIRGLSVPPEQRRPSAAELGRQLALLHRPAPRNAPEKPHRGGTLAQRTYLTQPQIERLPGQYSAVVPVWEQGLAAGPYGGTPLWLHGDIHPGNYLLKDDHTLAGIIDFGDVCQGDPAFDLATAWVSFDAAGRDDFFGAYFESCREETRLDQDLVPRAKGWAASAYVIAVLSSDLSTPDFIDMAQWTMGQLLQEP